MSSALREILGRHRASGEGIYAVCSAHPVVLRASAVQASEDGSYLLVEATSNQVDQFGGYTGLTPRDFRVMMEGVAVEAGLPADRLILGGDHLGPNRWTDHPAEEAMALATALVEAYVEAGYAKIHLDCSMPCADDGAELSDQVVAERSARLMAAAEGAVVQGGDLPSYVIGTEVPPPGGARHDIVGLQPTPVLAAERTLQVHRAVFDANGLGPAWERVVALVVQPGVEFDHDKVWDYRPEGAAELSSYLESVPGLVYEAHSTDYQTAANLRALVRDHWAILKVGPGLTFALREALFALDAIRTELLGPAGGPSVRQALEAAMLADPGQWSRHYPGSPQQQALARAFSYSDRCRYYLPQPSVVAAVDDLRTALSDGIPETLLSQYLPLQYARVRSGEVESTVDALLEDHVRDVLRPYARAVRPNMPSGPT